MLPFALIFPGVGFTLVFVSLIESGKIPKFSRLVWGGLVGGVSWMMVVFPALVQNGIYLATYLIGLIYIAVLIWLDKIMLKRTPYGKIMLGKLSGFKRFLETAEKSRLESIAEQNSEYFYHILPYTYALGVSDVWMKQFETIALRQPKWYASYKTFHTYDSYETFHTYDNHETFHTYDFNHSMNDIMNRAQNVMSSSSLSNSRVRVNFSEDSFSGGGSSGGGFSGGGSSGGGSGGGGGGSW